MNLTEFLQQSGYEAVPLDKNGVGHFHTPGTLNGHPLTVLLDTGASQTVVSLALAEELGLELTKLPILGGGAGSATMEVFMVRDAQLMLGSVQPRYQEIVAMDMTHVNEALRVKGAEPISVVLGVDVFEAHAAVIDYGSSTLFLQTRS